MKHSSLSALGFLLFFSLNAQVFSQDLFHAMKTPVEQSVLFVSVNDNKVLYEKNSPKALIPASVTKVITSAAALARFSPNQTFKTKIYHTGRRDGQTVHGNLVVVGDGDPFLISEKLWQMAADIRHLGIRKITGDIIVDNSLFGGGFRDDPRKGSKGASSHAYDAPVSALGINFNTLGIALAPATLPGQLAIAELDPYHLPHVSITNRLKTSKAGKRFDITRMSNGGGKSQLLVAGTIPKSSSIVRFYRSIDDPIKTTGEQIRAFLQKEQVLVQGVVKEGIVPSNASPLLSVESFDVAYMVKGLNHYSNNYIADVMVKRLGAAFPKSGTPDGRGQGTYENGNAVLADFLKKDVGIKSDFLILNGSGLDPKNQLSAEQIVSVLTYMESQFELFPDFLASLPASGWGGTLNSRFGGSTRDLVGKVRAKTGTLTDPVSVSSLAGYLRHPRHGLVAFAIIENGVPKRPQPSIMDLRKRQEQAIKSFLATP